jgi:hypothetical protein
MLSLLQEINNIINRVRKVQGVLAARITIGDEFQVILHNPHCFYDYIYLKRQLLQTSSGSESELAQ